MLLLPGLICDAAIWRAQLARFPDAVAVDGYGDAATLSAMARAALAGAPDRVSLVGHSMGARVALEIWRMAPERVARIALVDTGVHDPKPGEPDSRRALLHLGEREGIDALVDAWLPPMVAEPRRRDAAFLAPLRAMCARGGTALYARQIEAMIARPEVESLLPTITVPTLVAVGRQDAWSPVAQHEAIAAAIPDAELVVLEDCGHMAPVEAPEQLNTALEQWLRRPTR